jgi:hypothetical protein
LDFDHLIFGFVSHFDIRISDLGCRFSGSPAIVQIMQVITGTLHQYLRKKGTKARRCRFRGVFLTIFGLKYPKSFSNEGKRWEGKGFALSKIGGKDE